MGALLAYPELVPMSKFDIIDVEDLALNFAGSHNLFRQHVHLGAVLQGQTYIRTAPRNTSVMLAEFR